MTANFIRGAYFMSKRFIQFFQNSFSFCDPAGEIPSIMSSFNLH